MTTRHSASENSLAIAMVELDRLERERKDLEDHRRELRATLHRQADDIRELGEAFRAARPRVMARQRRRASAEHERARAHERRLVEQIEREHASRLAVLAQSNAERRAALTRLEREVAAEFNPARAALTWLTPFAAAGLVAALGFMAVHQQTSNVDLTRTAVDPVTAVADPQTSEPSPEEPVIVSDAVAPAIDEPAAIEPVPAMPSKPSKPSSSKKHEASSKPVGKPVTKPVSKPNSKPIVLGGGEDPLGDDAR